METAALLVVAAAGLWLVATALLMALRPLSFLHVLSLTASSRRINNIEQGLRLLAGLALIIRAGDSKLPILFEVGGWFIITSSVILLVLPLRWHAAYAVWWSLKLKPWVVRAIASRLIGKTASHGCVRLTNWDAAELGQAVEKGTVVEFL